MTISSLNWRQFWWDSTIIARSKWCALAVMPHNCITIFDHLCNKTTEPLDQSIVVGSGSPVWGGCVRVHCGSGSGDKGPVTPQSSRHMALITHGDPSIMVFNRYLIRFKSGWRCSRLINQRHWLIDWLMTVLEAQTHFGWYRIIIIAILREQWSFNTREDPILKLWIPSRKCHNSSLAMGWPEANTLQPRTRRRRTDHVVSKVSKQRRPVMGEGRIMACFRK